MFFYSPLEQFEILPIFQNPFFILTNSILILILGFSFIYFFFYINKKKLIIPTYIEQNLEFIYNTTFNLTYSNIGKKGRFFFPFIFILFFFLLLCNLIGMVPYSFTLTSHLIITLSLSLTIYIGFNIIGLQKHKFKFFGLLLPSGADLALLPLLVPIELVSYIFWVISLPVRLFANMMAGHTLLKVIAGFAWAMISIPNIMFIVHVIPLGLLILLIGLELGVAIIQAYVFTILTCMYINDALNLH